MHGKRIEINTDELGPLVAKLQKISPTSNIGVWHSPFWSRQFLCNNIGAGCGVLDSNGARLSTDVICYEDTPKKALEGVLHQLEQLYPQ
jgi:hypothetical protein